VATARTTEEEAENERKLNNLKKGIVESITDHFDKCKQFLNSLYDFLIF
jgi:hypothetical protein